MLRYRDAYSFPCPLCGVTIALPRQSPLGIFLGQQCQPTDEWPIKLLCIPHERVCDKPGEGFHRGFVEQPNQNQPLACLWRIDCECAHENCKRHSSIYTWWPELAEEHSIVDKLLQANVKIACDSNHQLSLRREKIRAEKLEH
jgi:hypothetical protein